MLSIKSNDADVIRIQKILKGTRKNAEKVIVRAVNRTATSTKSKIAPAIRREYVIDSKIAKGDGTYNKMFATKANISNLGARLLYKGRMIPLNKFKMTPDTTTPTANLKERPKLYKAKTKKGRVKRVPGVFLAKMKNGHVGAFRRVKTGGKMAAKLPVEGKYGPSIPQMINNEKVSNELTKYSSKLLKKRIFYEMNYMLSKGK